MSSVNSATIVGRLGKDPEVRYTQGGDAVASFSVATSEKWKDKSTGDMQERTEWHRCTAWRRLGEVCGEYLRKGSLVYIEGKLQTRKWQDKDGVEKYSTEIIVNQMKMLGPKPDGETQGRQQQAPKGRQQQAPMQSDDDIDADIPF